MVLLVAFCNRLIGVFVGRAINLLTGSLCAYRRWKEVQAHS